MEIVKKIILSLLKDFTRKTTITFLAQELKVSRVGIWKVLKKLEAEEREATADSKRRIEN